MAEPDDPHQQDGGQASGAATTDADSDATQAGRQEAQAPEVNTEVPGDAEDSGDDDSEDHEGGGEQSPDDSASREPEATAQPAPPSIVSTILGDHNTQAGRDVVNIYGEANERPKYRPLPRQDVERARAVFVEPAEYDAALARPLDELHPRVYLVHGPDHAGKWTCAVNLARDLSGRLSGHGEGASPTIEHYSRPLQSEISLADALAIQEELPKDAVVLLDDCFARNVKLAELAPRQIGDLRTSLANANSLLVLTGELDGQQLQAIAAITLDAQVRDLFHVLERNLRYSVANEGLALSPEQLDAALRPESWRILQPLLVTPFHVHQFCLRLRDLVLEVHDDHSLQKALSQAAKIVSIVGRHAGRIWFDALHPNEKLLGTLAYLLPGAERPWVEELNRRLVRQLRAGGWNHWLVDPRELGLDDALEHLQLLDQGGRLEFADRAYERETNRQLANRHHLLWDALDLASAPNMVDAQSEGWKRQALGVALGRLGPHDRRRLVAALEKLAGEADRRRAVIPGYALQELVRIGSPLDTQLTLGLLSKWVRSRQPGLMWAAAAALWRVFLALAQPDAAGSKPQITDGVFNLLRRLSLELRELSNVAPGAAFSRRDVEGGLVEALRQVTLADPARGFDELRRWLLGKKPQPQLARRTIRALCQNFSRSRSNPSREEVARLLELVAPLLRTAPDSPATDVVFLTLRAWLPAARAAEAIGREILALATHGDTRAGTVKVFTLGEQLRSALTRLWLDPRPRDAAAAARLMVRPQARGDASQLDARDRREVERLLNYWCDSSQSEARRIARASIARSYAVDGALPSLPVMGRAVAVVDPELLTGHQPEAIAVGRDALWKLLALLDSRFELTLLRLGETAGKALVGQPLSSLDLSPEFPVHRLLLPGLSRMPTPGGKQVFVLAARPPHDFDDLGGLPEVTEVCWIGPLREDADRVDGFAHDAHLPLPWPPTPAQLDAATTALEARLGRALASAPAELWLELLRGCGVDPGSEERRSALLAEWALALESLPAEGRLDPVWMSVVLLLFHHACDRAGALGWIASWLTAAAGEPSAPARRVVARAAAFALIRLATAYPAGDGATPPPSTSLFEQLADPLASQGPDGVAAVVRLVGHWLEHPVWAKFLAGDVRLGQGRLERWAAAHLHDAPELAEQLVQRLAAAGCGLAEDDAWVALTAAMDRLRARRALEHPRSLPNLGQDQQYAVLLVNTTGDPRRERHLAAVAASLHAELPRSSEGRLVPTIYRLGDVRPFWTATAEAPAVERLLPAGVHLPPLIGPVLATLDVHRVAQVLLLSSVAPHDLDDWLATDWWSKMRLYAAGEGPSLATFATLPRPLPPPAAPAAATDHQETRTLAALLAGLEGAAEKRPGAATGG